MFSIIQQFLRKSSHRSSERSAVEAYNIWSETYDAQPGNLMLDLDEDIVGNLIRSIDLRNKKILDFGCGTGRHWVKLYDRKPALVMGVDVSAGMLDQLKRKFPEAHTCQNTDNRLENVANHFFDSLITTLTVAHIEDIHEAIGAWSRVLKPGGDLLVTDFHPAMLAHGGKRTFQSGKENISIVNYIHSLETLKRIFDQYGLYVVDEEERYVDEAVRHYYVSQNALDVYDQYKGFPIIYGLLLKKRHAAA